MPTKREAAWPERPNPRQDADADRLLPPVPASARCDRCGYPAYVSALFMAEMTTLYFCSHHYRIHQDAIDAQADEIRDDRHVLVQREKNHK